MKPTAVTYQEAVNLFEKECNSTVRQTRVKNHWNGLLVEHFFKDGVEIATALAKVSAALRWAIDCCATRSTDKRCNCHQKDELYYHCRKNFRCELCRTTKARSRKEKFRSSNMPRKRANFKCGSEAHLVKQCPNPLHFSRATASRVLQLRDLETRKAVHLVSGVPL